MSDGLGSAANFIHHCFRDAPREPCNIKPCLGLAKKRHWQELAESGAHHVAHVAKDMFLIDLFVIKARIQRDGPTTECLDTH